MKTVTIVQPKGGVGKSTTTVMVSYALASSGITVGVCDLDANASAKRFLTAWPMPGIHLQEHISSPLPADCRLRLIDTPGKSLDEFPRLIAKTPPTDLYLLPTSPDGMDMEIVAEAAQQIREVRPNAKMILLWNRIVRRATDSDPKLLTQYAARIGVPALTKSVRQYKDTARARLDHGWKSVRTEIRNEWRDVAVELLGTLLGK